MAKKSRTAGSPASPSERAAPSAATRVDLPASAPDESTVLLDAIPLAEEDEGATQVLDLNAVAPPPVPSTPAPPAPAPTPAKAAAKTAKATTPATPPAAKSAPEPKSDEPSTGVMGLDVRMLWRGDTHAARFFPRPVPVTLGEDGTFALPPDAMGKKEKELTLLVEPHAGAGFGLRVDNPSARGHILVDGKTFDLAEVRAGNGALKGPVVPVTASTHAYVQFDEFTFLISRAAVPPPPPISLWSRENTIFVLCLLLALALLGGPLFAGFNSAEFRNRAKLSYLEQVEQDLRKPETIEVLIQEEKKEEQKPEEQKADENKPSEAAPIAPPSEQKVEKKAEEIKDALKDLNEEERKAKVTDIVRDEMQKNTAAIDDALKDVGGPSTKLFAADDGSGGDTMPGVAADSSNRAADALGGPGGRRGAGDGSETGRQVAAGLGKDNSLNGKDPSLNVKEQKQNLVRVGGSVGDATGELPKPVIKAYIATKMGAIKACYQKGLQANPDLSGKIKVKFLIQPNGAVNPAKIDESTIGNDGVENCVLNNVKAWKFPQAKGGGVTTVVYPFVFASH